MRKVVSLNRWTLIKSAVVVVGILLCVSFVLRWGKFFGDYNVIRTVKVYRYLIKLASANDERERQRWIKALKEEGPPAIKILRKPLQFKKHPEICRWAATTLGAMDAREAVPDLIAALNDVSVQWYAIYALADIKDKSAVPALLELLDRDLYWFVKGEVLYALGKIGDRKAIPALIETLRMDAGRYNQSEIAYLHRCAMRSLNVITGQYFGDPRVEGDEQIVIRWVDWWEKQKKERPILQEIEQSSPNMAK